MVRDLSAQDTMKELKCLVIDDDEVDSQHTSRLLRKGFGPSLNIHAVSSWDSALASLEQESYDVCIIDQFLGPHRGVDLLREYRREFEGTVFILLTGQHDRTIDVAAAEAGAAGYLLKSDISSNLLERSVRFALSLHQQKRELVKVAEDLARSRADLQQALERAEDSERKYRHLAQHDVLTGLPNRMLLGDRLQMAVADMKRNGELIALLHCDLDNFKHTNDKFGHQAGDYLLREIGHRLSSCIRETDTAARIGGDEFCVLLKRAGSSEDVKKVAQKIVDEMAKPFEFKGQTMRTGMSIGISLPAAESDTWDQFHSRADQALYVAKKNGKNQFVVFDPDLEDQRHRISVLGRDMFTALTNKDMFLEFQPKVNLTDGSITGAEALLRWNHATYGRVSPAEFIPQAEEGGQIFPISEFTLREAARMAREISQDHGKIVPIAVNISALLLKRGNLPALITDVLREFGLPPSALILEITETTAVDGFAWASDQITELRAMGVRISIDDFGTGYASLAVATRIPADEIKIDRSFIHGMLSSNPDYVAVKTTVTLAHSLGLKVIAEGVEEESQRAALRDLNCDLGQGYLFARPLSEERFKEYVQQQIGEPRQRHSPSL